MTLNQKVCIVKQIVGLKLSQLSNFANLFKINCVKKYILKHILDPYLQYDFCKVLKLSFVLSKSGLNLKRV